MTDEPRNVLLIDVAGHPFALPMDVVREVLPAATLSPPPRSDDTREGLLNLRGTMVPVVDLATPLGFDRAELRPEHQFVVLSLADRLVAVRSERPAEMSPGMPVAASQDAGTEGNGNDLCGPTVRIGDAFATGLDPRGVLARAGGETARQEGTS